MTLDDRIGQNIQIIRIGRATDKKPNNKLWFTTQMQDLFQVEPTAMKLAILSDLIDIIGEDEPQGKVNIRTGELYALRNQLRQELRERVKKYCD